MLRDFLRPGAAVFAGCTLLLTACGGGSDDATAEVATLQAPEPAIGDAADAAVRTDGETEELTPDEAALEFSQCMRDQGLDFPDLSVDAEGNIELRAAFQTVDPQADGFQEASQACGEVLQQAGFGGGRRQAGESPEVQDALLEFSSCVRAAGYDVGDLTLQGPGQAGGQGGGQEGDGQGGDGSAADDGDQAGQQGQARQGFGGRGSRFADQLGLDYDDPAVEETIDGCLSIIDEAFASVGIEQAPARG